MERGSGFCTVIITDLGRRKGVERDHNGWGLDWGKDGLTNAEEGGALRDIWLMKSLDWKLLRVALPCGSASLPSLDLGITEEGYIVFQLLNWLQSLIAREPVN